MDGVGWQLGDLNSRHLLPVLTFEILSINRMINVIQEDYSLFEGVVCWAWILFTEYLMLKIATVLHKNMDGGYGIFFEKKRGVGLTQERNGCEWGILHIF